MSRRESKKKARGVLIKAPVQWRFIFLRILRSYFFILSFFPPLSALSNLYPLCLSLCCFQYALQLLSPPLFVLAIWVFPGEGKGTFCRPTDQANLVNRGEGNPHLLLLNLSFLSLGLYFQVDIGGCWLCYCLSFDRCTQIQEVIQILYDFFYPQKNFLQRK